MVELVQGFWCDPFEVKIVKKIDDKSCILYITGEGAMDGHVLEYSAEDVVDVILEERRKIEEGEEEENADDLPHPSA